MPEYGCDAGCGSVFEIGIGTHVKVSALIYVHGHPDEI